MPHRVLSDPQKLLPHFLRNEVDRLSPDIIAMYIQAVLKIFGSWAVELAQRWGDDELTELKEKVKSVVDRMRELAASEHIEVQERVSIHFFGGTAYFSFLFCRLPMLFNCLTSYQQI